MDVRVETITPEKAEKYLERNISNYRKLETHRVDSYAKDMKHGRWELNGESIKFNLDGELTDGQHRLKAIIKANVPVQMLVIRGIENGISLYDIGKNRTMFQIATASGIKENVRDNAVLGAVSILLSNDFGSQAPAKGDVIGYIKKHQEEFAQALSIVRSGMNKSAPAKKAPVLLAIYCMTRCGVDISVLSDFCFVVNSGFPMENRESTAAIVLRNFLLGTTTVAPRNFLERKRMQYSSACSAINDFLLGNSRRQMYRYDEKNMKYINSVKKMDELE